MLFFYETRIFFKNLWQPPEKGLTFVERFAIFEPVRPHDFGGHLKAS